ncbi:MAG: patatin-like phospholipase family protein [Atopobiaceae bacterium]|jgi:predicted acylesterase/phospholipase RssA|nr:patatin-like phospholipase family protein [Olegusella sp.]MCI1933673.1 patatin-like phospholipase family protein [Atopobiaceae bacterium]
MKHLNGVGIAFCGGGFRSFAEVAAVEDMERAKVHIAAAAGTSMGSLVATLVAAGLPAKQIAELLVEMDQRIVEKGILRGMKFRVISLANSNGLIENSVVEEQARHTLHEAGIETFSDLVMPLAIPAVDILTGDLCVFTNSPELFADTSGGWTLVPGNHNLAKVITASASYPLAIQPTHYMNRLLMDGGCRLNLPTPLFDRESLDAVVGIGMIRDFKPLKDVNPLSIVQRTLSYGARSLDYFSASAADLYINLPVSGEDAFQAGTGKEVIKEARDFIHQNPIAWDSVKPDPLASLRKTAADSIARLFRGTSMTNTTHKLII